MRFLSVLFLVLFVFGCSEKHTPKPRGFFRIDFPKKSYSELQGNFPYEFEVPDYAIVSANRTNPAEKDWITVEVPANNAQIHFSYYDLETGSQPARELLIDLMEETRSLAYKHSIKATAIDEKIFVNRPEKVYGTIYNIHGNAASPMQFFLTDSTKHFLRGAFYISEVPDIDSLRPVINFLEPDVIRMIETTHWK